MSNFENSRVRGLVPYVAGEQPQDKKYVKLNTNENPYPPSHKIAEYLAGCNISDLKLYPDPNCTRLKTAIGKRYGLCSDNVFVGNGSDEVLALVFGSFFEPKSKPVAFADITYSFYKVYVDLCELNVNAIPLKDDYSLDVSDYVSMKNVCGIVICNPNAPTAMAITAKEVESIVSSNPDVVVVVDEAYVDFCEESVVHLVPKYNNLVVVQTFSKSYSLAGIRCGFALANAELVNTLEKLKNSFNSYTLDRLCQNVCEIAINDIEHFNINVQSIKKTRDNAVAHLQQLGFEVLPPSANFVFARHKKFGGEYLYKALYDRGVLVRYFKKPRIDNFLRITVGSDSEMEVLFNTLKEILTQ